jgi:hypothetical protein
MTVNIFVQLLTNKVRLLGLGKFKTHADGFCLCSRDFQPHGFYILGKFAYLGYSLVIHLDDNYEADTVTLLALIYFYVV